MEGAVSQDTPARGSSVLGFKPCRAAAAGAAGTPTQGRLHVPAQAGQDQPQLPGAPQHCQHPQNLLSSLQAPPELCLSCGWSTNAKNPLWLPGHVLDLC